MKKSFTILFFLFLCSNSQAQYITEFHSEHNDSFREWNVVLEIDSTTIIEGQLSLTWGLGDDFTDWQYSIGDFDGNIVQKYRNNPAFWELRQGSEIISITRTWPNDPTSWKIKSGKLQITIKSVHGNTVDEWQNRNPANGDLIILTETEGDPRDWLIDDYMNDTFPFTMRMAAVFISIYSSCPKI